MIRLSKRYVAVGAAALVCAAGAAVASDRPGQRDRPPGGDAGQVTARPWITGIGGPTESEDPTPVPEGPAFTADGDLVFVSAFGDDDGNKVFSVDVRSRKVEPVYADDTSVFTSIDVAEGGTWYLTDYLGAENGAGRIVTMNPDGTGVRTIVDGFKGSKVYPDDLVLDGRGGFFYTDMQGNTVKPTGRVIHVDRQGRQRLVTGGLAFPNGIGLSPDGSRLWVSEHLNNRLIGLDIDSSGRIVETSPGVGTSVFTHYSGGLVDSLTVDREGNVYTGMIDGARAEIVDDQGNPVSTVTPQGDAHEAYPNTTSVVIQPGTRNGFLFAGGPDGISILRFRSPASALAVPGVG